MPDTALFLIGLFVFTMVMTGVLFVAHQDAVDRKREGGEVDSPIDEKLVDFLGER